MSYRRVVTAAANTVRILEEKEEASSSATAADTCTGRMKVLMSIMLSMNNTN